jgi:GH24 family phage-related lysozyme (muramidase)
MTFNWLDQALKDARDDEGFREYAYPDVRSKLFKATRNSVRWGYVPARNVQLPPGVSLADGAPWTVGYGYTHGVQPDTRFTKEMAEHKLREVIQMSVKDSLILVPNFNDQPDVIKTVLVSMCYNMGRTTLSQFRNTLKAFREKRYEDAAKGMEASAWYKQVGIRAKKLVKRVRTLKIEE